MIILGRVRFGEENGKDESKRREKGKRGPDCRGGKRVLRDGQ